MVEVVEHKVVVTEHLVKVKEQTQVVVVLQLLKAVTQVILE